MAMAEQLLPGLTHTRHVNMHLNPRQNKREPPILTDKDITLLYEKLVQTNILPAKAISSIIAYSQFLGLFVRNVSDNYITRPNRLVPPPDIEAVWRLHVLSTRSYTAMCTRIWNKYLHYDPPLNGADASVRRDYIETVEWYKQVYHAAPPAGIWPELTGRG